MKLQEIAHKLGCRLEGDPATDIKGVAGIDHAGAGQLTFLANRRYSPLLKTTRASAVLVEDGVKLEREDGLRAFGGAAEHKSVPGFCAGAGIVLCRAGV